MKQRQQRDKFMVAFAALSLLILTNFGRLSDSSSKSSSFVKPTLHMNMAPSSSTPNMTVDSHPPRTRQFRTPPEGVDYDTNPSVFGKILSGKLSAAVYAENDRLFCFRDIHPRAPLHALVIPKFFVRNIHSLTCRSTDSNNDNSEQEKFHAFCDNPRALLQELRDMAGHVLQMHQPEAWAQKDYLLCFHVPPFNSVDHLHLHVLAPASRMGWFPTHIKYNPNAFWVATWDDVMQQLENKSNDEK